MPRKKKPIVIIPCSSKKRKIDSYLGVSSKNTKMCAIDLYDGPLFKTFRNIPSKQINVDWKNDVYVLSAEYGLISIWKPIFPYDTLLGRDVSKAELATKLKRQLARLKGFSKSRPIYAFTSREYSDVLLDAGLSFLYVKGGIGTKRKRLKMLLKKNSLPKSYVEQYKEK